MAAQLHWSGTLLLLGGRFIVGRVKKATTHGKMYAYAVAGAPDSEPYESVIDCMQDCESEVRRLLREAGVDVMS